MAGAVKVNVRSVIAAWRKAGGGDFCMQLATTDDVYEAFFDVLEASDEAEEPTEGIYTQLGTQSPHGYVTMVGSVGDAAQLEAWLGQRMAER
jgi:hypothetical protein